MKIFPAILVISSVVNALGCPADPKCKCVADSINCYEAFFKAIPENIPAETGSLHLENGHIESIETKKLQHLDKLYELQINHNKVSEIENGAFDNLVSLRQLSLMFNNISFLEKGVFSSLEQLRVLSLSHNSLHSLEGVLDGLVSLEILTINDNQISHVSTATFSQLTNIHHLSLNRNNLKVIPEGTFANNKNMMLLALGSNPIQNIDSLVPLESPLHFLNMTDCHLTAIPKGLPSFLKFLMLGKNNISEVKTVDMVPYTNLDALVLEENNIMYIEKGTFSHMTQLTGLYLFVNNLKTIPGPFSISIKNLYLDNNQIDTIPSEMFHEGTELTLLSLRNNNISFINKESFLNLKSIGMLHLENNPISILHDNMFMLAHDLKLLSLNRLTLEKIHENCFLGLKSLKTLEMSFVKVPLEKISGNFFENIPNLTTLKLEDSPNLAKFILSNENVMTSLANLKEIDLMENKLTGLSPNFTNFLPHLTRINLAGNHFHCDPNILWLRNWHKIESQKFVMFSQVRCHTPRRLQGQRLSEIGLSQFYINKTGDKNANESTSDETFTTEESDTTILMYDSSSTITPIDYYDYDDNYYNPTDYHYDDDDIYTNNYITTTLGQTNTTSATTNKSSMSTGKVPLESASSSMTLKAAGITIGMAFAVIITMIVAAAFTYWCWKRRMQGRHGSAQQYAGKEDYVFIVSKTDIKTETKSKPRLSREQRGSATSRASEDITNQVDHSMKVYTLDVDT